VLTIARGLCSPRQSIFVSLFLKSRKNFVLNEARGNITVDLRRGFSKRLDVKVPYLMQRQGISRGFELRRGLNMSKNGSYDTTPHVCPLFKKHKKAELPVVSANRPVVTELEFQSTLWREGIHVKQTSSLAQLRRQRR
jgi:hypothetical protein